MHNISQKKIKIKKNTANRCIRVDYLEISKTKFLKKQQQQQQKQTKKYTLKTKSDLLRDIYSQLALYIGYQSSLYGIWIYLGFGNRGGHHGRQ